jgi:hypothetical protein
MDQVDGLPQGVVPQPCQYADDDGENGQNRIFAELQSADDRGHQLPQPLLGLPNQKVSPKNSCGVRQPHPAE